MSGPTTLTQSTGSAEPAEAPQQPREATYEARSLFYGNRFRKTRLPEGHRSQSHAITAHELTHLAIAAQTAEERGRTWERGNRKPITRERDQLVDRITIRLPRSVGRQLRRHLLESGETQTAFIRRLIERELGAGGE